MRGRTRRFLLLSLITLIDAYQWPSPALDDLERLLYEGDFVGSFTTGCQERGVEGVKSDTKASFAAEWLRFAYHDMATHNITDGTGGLDASILYELDRPENIGGGQKSTVGDFLNLATKYISHADIIAMGAVWGVAGCGGPTIPFRGGRIDALQAGRPGVPEPSQDLKSHIESFRLQGFTQTEMIQLVACGHTLGGVRPNDFPDIIPQPDPTVANLRNFDSTTAFDAKVVTEYLDGSTQNALVVSKNTTMTSDLRIFSSDGNVTMHSLSANFTGTCAPLLERMINTVPKNVQLTDTIPLIPVKVKYARLDIQQSQLIFLVLLRVATPVSTNVTDWRVRLLWCDRRGEFADCNGRTNAASNASVLHDLSVSSVTAAANLSFATFQFSVPVQANQSVSNFWFDIDRGDSAGTTVYDNGGQEYTLPQDEIVFSTSLTLNRTSGRNGPTLARPGLTGQKYKIVAGIRKESSPVSAVMKAFDRTSTNPIPGEPLNTTINLVPDFSKSLGDGYNYYSANISSRGLRLMVDLEAVINGTTYTQDAVDAQFGIGDLQFGIFGSVTTFASTQTPKPPSSGSTSSPHPLLTFSIAPSLLLLLLFID